MTCSILFYPGAGLGDTVLSLPVLELLRQYFSGTIDIVTRQNAEAVAEVYYGLPDMGKIHTVIAGQEAPIMSIYDVVVVANEQVTVQIKPHAQPQLQDFIQLVQRGFNRREAFGVVNQVTDLLNNQLAHHAVLLGLNRCSLPLYSLGAENYHAPQPQLQLRENSVAVLALHGLTEKNYITVQDGWDANFAVPDHRPTKAWRIEAWVELVELLKQEIPKMKIVQLGSPKSGAAIAGVDVNLRGHASLAEAFAVLKHAALHIDTEGGLVHVAHALGTRSLVLFGPTNAKFFGYADNINLVPPCHDCWWLKADWMRQCIRGLVQPECMLHHAPRDVAQAVIASLMGK